MILSFPIKLIPSRPNSWRYCSHPGPISSSPEAGLALLSFLLWCSSSGMLDACDINLEKKQVDTEKKGIIRFKGKKECFPPPPSLV